LTANTQIQNPEQGICLELITCCDVKGSQVMKYGVNKVTATYLWILKESL